MHARALPQHADLFSVTGTPGTARLHDMMLEHAGDGVCVRWSVARVVGGALICVGGLEEAAGLVGIHRVDDEQLAHRARQVLLPHPVLLIMQVWNQRCSESSQQERAQPRSGATPAPAAAHVLHGLPQSFCGLGWKPCLLEYCSCQAVHHRSSYGHGGQRRQPIGPAASVIVKGN